MDYRIDDYFEIGFTTSRFSTGAAYDASSLPTFRVYEENNETAVATGTCAKRDDANTTGYYYVRGQCTTALGYEVGKVYFVYVNATVDGVAGSAYIGSFRITTDAITSGYKIQTYTLNVPEGGPPCEGALVLVTSDAAGQVEVTHGYTNDDGQFKFVGKTNVRYRMWPSKIGVDFSANFPDEEVGV